MLEKCKCLVTHINTMCVTFFDDLKQNAVHHFIKLCEVGQQ